LGKIVRTCEKIMGQQQHELSSLYLGRALQKENKIAVDSPHPLHPEFQLLPSGHRYRQPKVKNKIGPGTLLY
jgi:hypothetical protein